MTDAGASRIDASVPAEIHSNLDEKSTPEKIVH
jgi:hypothetical protein